MPTIIPHLWFDTQAVEAAERYTGVFQDSRLLGVTTLGDTPSGNVDIVNLALCGQRFQFISAGPLFRFTPAISFRVDCATAAEVDSLYGALSEGGSALMPLGAYPFSDRYAWLEDRYGLSWQLMHADTPKQRITPMLMFVGAQCGKAGEAIRFYCDLFPDAHIDGILHYGDDELPETEGTIKQAAFRLAAQAFAAMDSALMHNFGFNEAISLMVYCQTQAEIDHYWDALSSVPEAEQCGWLKDRFGVSWQIVPEAMDAMMSDPDPQKVARVTQAFLPMKKLNLAALEVAYAGG